MGFKAIYTPKSIKLKDTKTGKMAGSIGKGKITKFSLPKPSKSLDSFDLPVLKEAYGWNISGVMSDSQILKEFKCQVCNAIRLCSPSKRITGRGSGVIFCLECPDLRKGSLSLLEEYPKIASEAYGWNPAKISSHNRNVVFWICEKCDNVWPARVCNRTGSTKTKCPKCSIRDGILKKQHTQKIQSFASVFPSKAMEAYGWDPSLYSINSRDSKEWLCPKCGEIYKSNIKERANKDTNSNCTNHHVYNNMRKKKYGKITYGFFLNQKFVICSKEDSLLTRFPDLVTNSNLPIEIAGKVSAGSNLMVKWSCPDCGWAWPTTVSNRALKAQGCAQCSKTGFNYEKPGFIYFIKGKRLNHNLTQYGITNNLKNRISYHKRNGFYLSEESELLSFTKGEDAFAVEKLIKEALKTYDIPSVKDDPSIEDKFAGYSESFLTKNIPVNSLRSFLTILNISIENYEHEWIKYK